MVVAQSAEDWAEERRTPSGHCRGTFEQEPCDALARHPGWTLPLPIWDRPQHPHHDLERDKVVQKQKIDISHLYLNWPIK